MCLITNLKKPFVAKSDITVYKKLLKTDSKYITPYQETPVTLNAMLQADSDTEYVKPSSKKVSVGVGFIHAYLSVLNENEFHERLTFKAIIPKGTEFYISDDLREICSRQLFITDEKVDIYEDMPSFEERVKELYQDYFTELYDEQEIDGKTVAVGYLCLEDKTFIRPDEEHDGKEVIGIVGNIKDGVITVISLDETTLMWSTVNVKVYAVSEDGKVNTQAIRDFVARRDGEYPLFDWVDNYATKGTEKGDWYIGSAREVRDVFYLNWMVINVGLIEADLAVSRVDVQFGDATLFWTSSEFSKYNARYVLSETDGVYDQCKDYPIRSRAFLRL